MEQDTRVVILTDAPKNAAEIAREEVEKQEGADVTVDILRQDVTSGVIDGVEYDRIAIVEVGVRR